MIDLSTTAIFVDDPCVFMPESSDVPISDWGNFRVSF